MKTLSALIGSRYFLTIFCAFVGLWIVLNSLPFTGHFDPYPFYGLELLMLWMAFMVFSVICWQHSRNIAMLESQIGAHAKTWTKIEWEDARIDLLQAEVNRVAELLSNLREDHERLVSLSFEEQNLLQTSKNQHNMLNDRLISIAKEVESLVDVTVKLHAIVVEQKKKKW